MNNPGHWLSFIQRNDNRGLSVEQIRQKYVKEMFMFEQYVNIFQAQQAIGQHGAAGGGGSSESTPLALVFTFNDINNTPIADPYQLLDWNTFFDFPTNGNPFTSVEVDGNTVRLFGGSDVIMKFNFFDGYDSLLSVDDQIGCVIELGENVFGDDNIGGSYNLVSVNFPNVTAAGPYCFNGCTSLTDVNMPSLITIGNAGFSSCGALITISLPELTTTGNGCFNDCVSLTTVTLPKLTNVAGPNSGFTNCISLTAINLPELTVAGDSFLASCQSLTTVNLPKVTFTGGNCFSGCTLLTSVNLPLATNAGDYSFSDCTSITSIYMPLCATMGATVGDDNMFLNISGNTIELTVSAVLEKCDSGNPDGDIVTLDNNNTLTVNYV